MLVMSLRFQAPAEKPPPPPPPPPPPSPLPAPLISEGFADGNYRDRGWHHGYHPQVVDAQLNRSVYQIRWDGTNQLPVKAAGTTPYPLYKRLPTKVRELTIAYKFIPQRWSAEDQGHLVGTVPAQDLDDNLVQHHAGYLANSSGRWYFEPGRPNFRWNGVMQARYTNNTGWVYLNPSGSVLTVGAWHEVVTFARQNTAGQSDGVFRAAIRKRGLGVGGLWGAWSEIIDQTFGNMVSNANPALIQSWITVEPYKTFNWKVPSELRMCDLRVYAGNQYDAYQEVNDGNA